VTDGVYDVTTPYLSAGFALRDGEVVWCAPILRRRLRYWMTVAVWVGPLPPVLQDRPCEP
jgi:hypothetical protein